jgi:hypothetical protein
MSRSANIRGPGDVFVSSFYVVNLNKRAARSPDAMKPSWLRGGCDQLFVLSTSELNSCSASGGGKELGCFVVYR